MYSNVLSTFDQKAFRMKAKLLILLTIPALFYACNKDAYTSKPQIKIKDINTTTLSSGGLLLFQIEFTDKEGDIQDTLWVQKISKKCPGTPGAQFISRNRVPDFTPTANLKGILEIGYGYNANISGYSTITGCGNQNDTAYFKFWLKDKANNVSDTITSPDIVLLK